MPIGRVDSGYNACRYGTRVLQQAAEAVLRTIVTKERWLLTLLYDFNAPILLIYN